MYGQCWPMKDSNEIGFILASPAGVVSLSCHAKTCCATIAAVHMTRLLSPFEQSLDAQLLGVQLLLDAAALLRESKLTSMYRKFYGLLIRSLRMCRYWE